VKNGVSVVFLGLDVTVFQPRPPVDTVLASAPVEHDDDERLLFDGGFFVS
jgi:hypothetical protein